jgi:hypothetical protein
MDEERLTHLLRGLPLAPASDGFTAQVLRRLDGEEGGPAVVSRRRMPAPPPWHRLMLTTATVAALSVSIVVSVGLLQPERRLPAPPAGGALDTAGRLSTAAASSLGGRPAPPLRSLRQGAAAETAAIGARPAANRSGAAFDSARAHRLLREMQLESLEIGRELSRLRRLAPTPPPAVVYLGGDESVDLVLSTGRGRAQGPLLTDRDGGDNHDYLD